MKTLHLVLLLAGVASAAEPAAGHKGPKLPELPKTPVIPTPMPDPGTAVVLSPLANYIIDSDVECIVLCSPQGVLKVTADKGPMTVRGEFVDGKGIEKRTYAGPYLYFVEPATDGQCELIVIPVGSKGGDIVRRTILSQTGPRPPPEPKPDPKPDPKPKPDPVTSFRVIFIYESGDTLSAEANSVIYGKVVEDFLNKSCTGGKSGWRRRDKDTGGENDPTMLALWNAVKPKVTTTPCVAIEVNGKAEIVPVEATPAAMVAVFNKYLGGK